MMAKRFRNFLKFVNSVESFTAGQVSVLQWDEKELSSVTLQVQPSDGLYEGGRFKFLIMLDDDYPHKAPEVICETSIYHPNIDPTCEDCNNVCLNLLDEWTTQNGLEDLVQGLLFLFYNPNVDDPLSPYFGGSMTDEDLEKAVRASLRGEESDDYNFPYNYYGNNPDMIKESEHLEDAKTQAINVIRQLVVEKIETLPSDESDEEEDENTKNTEAAGQNECDHNNNEEKATEMANDNSEVSAEAVSVDVKTLAAGILEATAALTVAENKEQIVPCVEMNKLNVESQVPKNEPCSASQLEIENDAFTNDGHRVDLQNESVDINELENCTQTDIEEPCECTNILPTVIVTDAKCPDNIITQTSVEIKESMHRTRAYGRQKSSESHHRRSRRAGLRYYTDKFRTSAFATHLLGAAAILSHFLFNTKNKINCFRTDDHNMQDISAIRFELTNDVDEK